MIQIMRQLLHSSLEMFSGADRAVKNLTFSAFFDVLQSAQRVSCFEIYLLIIIIIIIIIIILQYARLRVVTK